MKKKRDSQDNGPLTAEEYKDWAYDLFDIAEEQRKLDTLRADTLKEMGIGQRVEGANITPVGELLLAACNQPAGQALIVSFIPEQPIESRKSTCADTGEADLIIEDVHNYPLRVRPGATNGRSSGMTLPMLQCADSGRYLTLEAHRANRTPRYRTAHGILPTYEIVR